jgi:hypothetical protein
MLDNVEKIESDYSTRESRQWWAELDAETQAHDDHAAKVGTVLLAIRDLAVLLTNADLCQVLLSLGCRVSHMPEVQQHLDECIGLVESCE